MRDVSVVGVGIGIIGKSFRRVVSLPGPYAGMDSFTGTRPG
jgi:hypothetical protein